MAERAVEIVCDDGVRLGGHLWSAQGQSLGSVIVNCATGVLARYYHRYACYLSEQGFDVLTYDFRGIGASRPPWLRGCNYRWHDWGELDFDAALRFMRSQAPGSRMLVVGHSFGGFLPGLAEGASSIDRMLTVGAQYAYWPDYTRHRRARLFLKWHLAMPIITALCGYFPGRRLGWLEDLPAGVANQWSFRRSRIELAHPHHLHAAIRDRFARVEAPILAVSAFDDEFATAQAIRRGLDYYSNAHRTVVRLGPVKLAGGPTGHFGLFHSSHASGFWADTVAWLRDGSNPWLGNTLPPERPSTTQGYSAHSPTLVAGTRS